VRDIRYRSRILPQPAKDEMLARLADVLKERSEIAFAYVHGSFVEPGPFRDLDLAVWVDPKAAPDRHPVDYEMDLALSLQRRLGIPVDVKRLNEAPVGFCYQAARGLPIMSRDDEVRDTWLERTRDAYWDFQPVARRHLAELLRE